MSPIGAHKATILGAAGRARGADMHVGTFVKQAGTGNQDITLPATCPDLSGAAAGTWAIKFWAAGSDAASGTYAANVFTTMGFVANGGGSLTQHAVGTFSVDGAGTTDTSRRTQAACLATVTSGDTLKWEATFVSFINDAGTPKMRINWGTNSGGLQIICYAIFTGLTNAKAVAWDMGAGTGARSITGATSTSDLVFLAGAPISGGTGTAGNVWATYGVCNAAGEQGANGWFSQDSVVGSNTSRYQRTDSLFAIPGNAEAVEYRASYSAMTATGLDITVAANNGWSGFNGIALFLDGISSKIGAFNKNTGAAPVSQAITGVGFQPVGLFLTGFGDTTFTNPQASGKWYLGAADGTNEILAAFSDVDAVNPTQADSVWRNDKVGYHWSGTTDLALADLTSFDTDGFTLNWTQNEATATENIYVAVGA